MAAACDPWGIFVDYQVWIRALLSDAASKNKAYTIAALGPHTLRTLYDKGVPPTVELVAKRRPDGPAEQAKAKCA